MPDFEFRPTGRQDFAFCWPIYRDAMQPLVAELTEWHEPVQRQLVEDALAEAGASILVAEGADTGWLQVNETRHQIHLAHFYLLPAARNKGLGTRFLTWMSERARRKHKDLTLDVLPNNRARFLYQRLGFGILATTPHRISLQLDLR